MRHKSRKVFIENEGFQEERPLTKLAQGLRPKVKLVRVEEVSEATYTEMRDGAKLFKVVVNFGGGEKELAGFAKDEIDVYRRVANELEGRGFKLDIEGKL